jgi:hypothetical protein
MPLIREATALAPFISHDKAWLGRAASMTVLMDTDDGCRFPTAFLDHSVRIDSEMLLRWAYSLRMPGAGNRKPDRSSLIGEISEFGQVPIV